MPKTTRGKCALVGACCIVFCGLLYLFGFLFIQTIMLVGYVAAFPMILIYEKNKRGSMVGSSSTPQDEGWSKTKTELDEVNRKIEKAKNQDESQLLQRQKVELQNKLRNLEWEIRESEMTQLYNATKGNMKISKALSKPELFEPESEKEHAIATNRRILLTIVKNAEFLIEHEPASSIKVALSPLERELKLHYNVLKKGRNQKAFSESILSDYWVTWISISCLVRGVKLDSKLTKYASKDYRDRFAKFLNCVGRIEVTSLT
jgi:hypothetical protein